MGCNSTKMRVLSTIESNQAAARKQGKVGVASCLLGCETWRTRGSIKTLTEEEQKLGPNGKD